MHDLFALFFLGRFRYAFDSRYFLLFFGSENLRKKFRQRPLGTSGRQKQSYIMGEGLGERLTLTTLLHGSECDCPLVLRVKTIIYTVQIGKGNRNELPDDDDKLFKYWTVVL